VDESEKKNRQAEDEGNEFEEKHAPPILRIHHERYNEQPGSGQ